MKIFLSTKNDLKGIVNVELNCGRRRKKGFEPLPILRKLFSDKKCNVFVAKEKGVIMGYVALIKKRNAGEVGFLAVLKKYQNKGVGFKLLLHVVNFAKKLKIKKLNLQVRKHNKKAIYIYTKMGFKFVSKKQSKKQNNKRSMEMEL